MKTKDEFYSKISTVDKLVEGAYFKWTDSVSAPVWRRGEYNRFAKKYSCCRVEDMNHERLVKKGTRVYSEFTY